MSTSIQGLRKLVTETHCEAAPVCLRIDNLDSLLPHFSVILRCWMSQAMPPPTSLAGSLGDINRRDNAVVHSSNLIVNGPSPEPVDLIEVATGSGSRKTPSTRPPNTAC